MRSFNAGIGTIASLSIVAFMKWEIALLMAIIIPISGAICKSIQRNMKKASDEVRKKQGAYSAWLMEMLKGRGEIKPFVAEQTVLKLFVHKNKDIVESSVKQDVVQFKADQIIDGKASKIKGCRNWATVYRRAFQCTGSYRRVSAE